MSGHGIAARSELTSWVRVLILPSNMASNSFTAKWTWSLAGRVLLVCKLNWICNHMILKVWTSWWILVKCRYAGRSISRYLSTSTWLSSIWLQLPRWMSWQDCQLHWYLKLPIMLLCDWQHIPLKHSTSSQRYVDLLDSNRSVASEILHQLKTPRHSV